MFAPSKNTITDTPSIKNRPNRTTSNCPQPQPHAPHHTANSQLTCTIDRTHHNPYHAIVVAAVFDALHIIRGERRHHHRPQRAERRAEHAHHSDRIQQAVERRHCDQRRDEIGEVTHHQIRRLQGKADKAVSSSKQQQKEWEENKKRRLNDSPGCGPGRMCSSSEAASSERATQKAAHQASLRSRATSQVAAGRKTGGQFLVRLNSRCT